MIEPPDAAIRAEFQNEYGERWIVEIDAERQTGLLRGDDTDWEPVEIRDGVMNDGLGLGDDEFEWLSAIWWQATGRKLRRTWIQRLESMVMMQGNADAN